MRRDLLARSRVLAAGSVVEHGPGVSAADVDGIKVAVPGAPAIEISKDARDRLLERLTPLAPDTAAKLRAGGTHNVTRLDAAEHAVFSAVIDDWLDEVGMMGVPVCLWDLRDAYQG